MINLIGDLSYIYGGNFYIIWIIGSGESMHRNVCFCTGQS